MMTPSIQPVILCIFAAAVVMPALVQAASSAAQIDADIQHLGDPDPAVRHAASDQLIAIGAPARAAVQKAARAGDPQVSDAARETLGNMPWSDPDDPPQVALLLKGYGQGSTADRIGIVGQLGETDGSHPALLRLLSQELNEDVCWQAVAVLLRSGGDPAILGNARQLDPSSGGSAALYYSGTAWLTPIPGATPVSDRSRGLALLNRAVESETTNPSFDEGLLDTAFDELTAAALDAGQPLEAIRLRRLQCKRIGINRNAFPSPFFALLSIFAQYGPLPGLQDVLGENDRFLGRPESLAILSRLYRRTGQQAAAATFEQLSLAAAVTPASQHLNAMFTDELGYDDLAADQSRAILQRGNPIPDSEDFDARERLARTATKRNDDASALQQLRIMLTDGRLRGLDRGTFQNITLEVAEHELRLARVDRDEPGISNAEARLLTLEPNGTDSAIDLVPLLHSQGRDDEATRVFDSTYEPMRKRLDAGESDPALLNELAWLCAKCDRKLNDALSWSHQAIAARPTSAAYLDTCAEANFRLGHAAESVKLEQRALLYEPGDLFMIGQLKRFKFAAATQPTSAPAVGSR